MPYFIQSKILDTFLQVLNMSLTASIIIVLVLVARLLLKKAPKIFSYALWSVVFFRLLCPISFESMFSLLPINASPISTNTIYSETPQISTGITTVDNAINPILPAPANGASDDNPLLIAATIGESLWIMGIVVLLIYSIISLLRLRKKLIGAVKLHDNIFLADHIVSPFVIGLFRPKIYLPSTLAEHEQSYIILHEQTHIRRFDHVMKIVAFAALCIHWFNPLVWIAFTLTIKDMEMSCDESVMKRLGANIREEYSALLLSLATGRKIIAGTPLAFGEGDTKSRIKNVLRYKKPALWVMLAALIVVSAICIAFASNPPRTSMEWAKKLRVEDVVKIELVVMASDEDARYRLFDRSEFSDVVALVNKSRGGYLPNPESLAGSGVTYYITTTDGVRHIFSNNGYLFIDGDSYDAGHHWLSSWGNVKGNAPLPEPFLFGNENFLTLDELKLIAQKGDAISWDDFASYHGQDVGSGLYIMRYPMEPPYYVMVGGVPGEPPMYVRLYSTETEQYIDIRQESIDDFIQKSDNENGSNSTIESIAWEFINDNIVNYEQTPGVEIIDSKISFLELVTRPGLDNLADRTIYVFFLEYRLLPKDLSKVVLAGGMDVDEQGWITERSSMGQPLIVAFEEEGKAELIGFLWTAEISEKNGGLEAAVKDLLEQKNDN